MVETFKSAADHILELSKSDARAFVALSIPFSSEYEIRSYKSPSAVPDALADLVIGDAKTSAIAYRGRLQGFTRAAMRREQNRGYGCE